MFDGSDRFETSEMGVDSVGRTHVGRTEWKTIDARLRALARRRAALDAEELALIRAAQRLELHRRLGMGSLREYLERVLGYTPRMSGERLRVAEALETLPAMRGALTEGELSFSAVRELTRVATTETEDEWLAAAAGRSMREIEAMVAGRRSGDRPDDDPDPAQVTYGVRFEVRGEAYALLRQAQQVIADRLGRQPTEDEVVAAMARALLDEDGADGERGRAPHQIALTLCAACDRGWQDGGGQVIEVPPEMIDRARCDAQHVGRVDGDAPARATQDVPPAVRRQVERRDHGRCCVPGCRASRGLDLHHLKPRALGGDHHPRNLCLVCSGHHAAVHAGTLVITGDAPRLAFHHADGRPYGAPPGPAVVSAGPGATESPTPPDVVADAIAALTQLGFRPRDARAAVVEAAPHVGTASLEDVIRRALPRAAAAHRARQGGW